MTKGIHSVFWACVAVSIILLCQSTQVFGYAEYYTYGNYNPTSSSDPGYYRNSDSSDTKVSFSRPVGSILTIGGDKSYATTSGYADARNLKMGVSGWAVSKSGNGTYTDAYMFTEASTRFGVAPGTSGLSVGDTTTLQLRVRLDGTLTADARSWPGRGWAHSDIDAGLSIRDSDAVVCEDGEGGCWSPQLAYFGASGALEAYDVSKPHWGYGYASPWEEYWRYGSNVASETTHDVAGETRELTEGMYYTAGRYIDTGWLTLAFEVIVGHTLDIETYMSTYVNANHEGEASSDFDNTFAFMVTPTVGGLELDWELGEPEGISDPQVVPEPSGVLLLGTGLLGLLGLRRIRARNTKNI